MEANVLIPVTAYGMNIMAIRPDGGRKFKARIGFRCNFHRFVERAIDRNAQLNGVNFGTILTDPHLEIIEYFHPNHQITWKIRTYNVSELDFAERIAAQRAGRRNGRGRDGDFGCCRRCELIRLIAN